ncbi:MAG: tetratricopeptide repeat protein, partial [Cyanobacteria bacterium]|nr:tetratricopeptide repeat protein [Cyanobacteriota bacterium]
MNHSELYSSQTTPEFSHALGLGKKYLEEGQFKEALGCLELAIDLQSRSKVTSSPHPNPPLANPSLGAAYLGAGQCLFALGRMDKAAHYLQLSLTLNPDCKETKRTLTALRYLGITEIEGLQRSLLKSFPNATESCWDIIIFSPCGVTELGGGQHPPQIARALEQLGNQVLYLQPFWGENYSEPFTVYQDPFLLQNGAPTSFQKNLLETLMTQFFGESGNTRKLALFTIFSPYLLGCVDFLKEQGFQCGY